MLRATGETWGKGNQYQASTLKGLNMNSLRKTWGKLKGEKCQ